jgi:hypothetical protein
VFGGADIVARSADASADSAPRDVSQHHDEADNEGDGNPADLKFLLAINAIVHHGSEVTAPGEGDVFRTAK